MLRKLLSALLAPATGGASLLVAGSGGGEDTQGPTLPPVNEQGPGLPAGPEFGPSMKESGLLRPDAGFGEIMGRVIQRQAERDQWMGNPLNRLGSKLTFGLLGPPGDFGSQDLFGVSDPSKQQQQTLDMANYLLRRF